MIDQAICKARLIVVDERDAIFPGDIPGRDDHEFCPINPRAKGKLFDLTPGNAATDCGAIEHAR